MIAGDDAAKNWICNVKEVKNYNEVYYLLSSTISKGHVNAPVGQITSHCKHQPHSFTSLITAILSTIVIAPQRHTTTHKPQPSQSCGSTLGISDKFPISHIHYFIHITGHFSVTFVSICFNHFFQGFPVGNYNTMSLEPDGFSVFQFSQ